MFLARVLTGRCAQSSSAYRRPPKDKRTGRLFDSVSNGTPVTTGNNVATTAPFGMFGAVGVGGVIPAVGIGGIFGGIRGRMQGTEYGVEVLNNKQNQAAVYVVFDPMQHYPEYVISY